MYSVTYLESQGNRHRQVDHSYRVEFLCSLPFHRLRSTDANSPKVPSTHTDDGRRNIHETLASDRHNQDHQRGHHYTRGFWKLLSTPNISRIWALRSDWNRYIDNVKMWACQYLSLALTFIQKSGEEGQHQKLPSHSTDTTWNWTAGPAWPQGESWANSPTCLTVA